jgi:signal peptidase I
MSKSKTAEKSGEKKTANKPAPVTWSHTLRETVESVAIAFILAFLFRTFEAEAFVIPTGSMAPTLQGRHKDVDCPQCGYHYRVSASSEVDSEGNPRNCNVIAGTCPMCGYRLDVDPRAPGKMDEYPSYNGDRIIVNKFAYDVSDPQRWDVVVFKWPGDAKTNYIKRLVGLPNERLKVQYGDVYTAPLGSDDFQIARKPPEKLRAMLQPVYDNDYVLPKLIEAGLEPRWQPWVARGQKGPWTTSSDYKSFTAEGSSGTAWLRYRHIVPTQETWREFENGLKVKSPSPTWIKDSYAYDAGDADCHPHGAAGENWVGDLALDCQLDVKQATGAVVLELVKGGRQFQCRIDLQNGDATLSIVPKDDSPSPDFAPKANTSVHGPGTYDVSFANVDEQLLLWVNGHVVDFTGPTTYPSLGNNTHALPDRNKEIATDLSPAGIAVEGGAAVQVNHVKLMRDIYYTVDENNGELKRAGFIEDQDVSNAKDLGPGQYFMMGDNSPESADSRYWGKVDRRLLIGKALFIYWPHSWAPSWAPTLRMFGVELKLPFWPNFRRMTFVH